MNLLSALDQALQAQNMKVRLRSYEEIPSSSSFCGLQSPNPESIYDSASYQQGELFYFNNFQEIQGESQQKSGSSLISDITALLESLCLQGKHNVEIEVFIFILLNSF